VSAPAPNGASRAPMSVESGWGVGGTMPAP
jgi:hypothetical protein